MDLKRLENLPPWEWPADAGGTLREALVDAARPAPERVLAARLAGELVVMNDDLAAALLSVVSDASAPDELRGAAAISLGPALEHAETMGFDDPDDVVVSEELVARIQVALHGLFNDDAVPETVRRMVLEASVRAPQSWHRGAIAGACASGDGPWRLTGIFCTQYVPGFYEEILEALDDDHPEAHIFAVRAAGNWEVEAAWGHIADLLEADDTPRSLLLAAIDAASTIRPEEALLLLGDLADSGDEEISEAALDAMAIAEFAGEEEDDDDDDDLF